MTADRPEYVACIRKGDTKEGLCGRYLGFEFAFVDAVHAKANADAGGRLVLCEDCDKKAFTEAGPALDALVAQKVMGLHVEWRKGVPMWVGKDLPGSPYVLEDGLYGHAVEPYSTDIRCAMEVAEKIHDVQPRFVLEAQPFVRPRVWWCSLYGIERMAAPTAPLAICRAALAFVQDEKERLEASRNKKG